MWCVLPCNAGDPTTLPFLMMVLIISKGVGDRFNYSVFHHQIMLKGFNFVGGLPEHLVKRAHLDVSVAHSGVPCNRLSYVFRPLPPGIALLLSQHFHHPANFLSFGSAATGRAQC